MRKAFFGAFLAVASALVPAAALQAQQGGDPIYGWCKAASAGTLYFSEVWSQYEDEAGYAPGDWFSRQLQIKTGATVSGLACKDGADKAAMEAQRNADMAAAKARGTSVAVLAEG
jgi:hypothetical protein